MKEAKKFILLTLLTIVTPAYSASQDVIVFDDTPENGFSFCVTNSQNYLIESSLVHSGSAAVRMSNTGGFVYLCDDSYLTFSDYDGISFWFNGGIDGGEYIVLEVSAKPGSETVSADVSSLYGGPLPANQWVHIQGIFSQPPFQGNLDTFTAPAFNRLTFHAYKPGNNPYYVDDIALTADGIFKNGLECSDPTAPSC